MENSSKALLIAAAVLIVILVITFAIKIFGSAKDSGDSSQIASELKSGTEAGADVVKSQIISATAVNLFNLNRTYETLATGESITNHLDERRAYLNIDRTSVTGRTQNCLKTNPSSNSITVTEPGGNRGSFSCYPYTIT